MADKQPTAVLSPDYTRPVGSYRLKHEVFAARRALYGIRNAEVIAQKGSISVQAVRKVLSGKQPNPQLRTLIAICQALDLTLEEVVDY